MSDSAFKNLISSQVIKKLGAAFKKADPQFNEAQFRRIAAGLAPLELKARVLLITSELRTQLPKAFSDARKILKRVLDSGALRGFELWPVSEYISQFGLVDFAGSLDLMYTMTPQFTAEFAVRSFLLKDPEKVLKQFEVWAKDDNHHVRRWVSEGSRPILPWGGKIPSFIKEPATLHLLEELKYDDELYVRKSVANHLNDITKNHPELVVETLQKWQTEAPEEQRPKIQWIVKHALRTLIKKGHPGALSLLGVGKKTSVELSKFKLHGKELSLGDALEFEFTLLSTGKKEQTLVVDYRIDFQKANGKTSAKVFKLKTLKLAAGESAQIKKRHSLKKITTMTFYPGKHEVQIQINGAIFKKAGWTLVI